MGRVLQTSKARVSRALRLGGHHVPNGGEPGIVWWRLFSYLLDGAKSCKAHPDATIVLILEFEIPLCPDPRVTHTALSVEHMNPA